MRPEHDLGDIGYVGYAQVPQRYTPPTPFVIPQVATLQPLTVLLRYQKYF